MKISVIAATEFMITIGWPSCVKWERNRLAAKLNQLANVVDESDAAKMPTPEGKQLFRTLLDASVRGETIELVEDGAAAVTEKPVAETPKRETIAEAAVTQPQAATSTPQAAKPADDGIDHSWDDIAGTVENQPSTALVETTTPTPPATPTAAEPKRRGRPALTEEEKAARKAAKGGTRTEDVNWDSPGPSGKEESATPGGLASPTVPGLTPEEMRLRQSAIEQEKAKVALPNDGKIPAPQSGPRGLLLGAIIAVDGLATIDDGSATLYASLRQSESAARNGRADLMKAAHIIEGYLVAMAELKAGKDPLAKWVSVLGASAAPTDFIAN